MEPKKLELILRIDWSEQDLFGHINNVMISKYIQSARVNLWDKIGLSEMFQNTKIGATVAATKVQFKQPLYYPGQIKIYTWIREIKNTSFIIQHEIFNESKALCVVSEDVIVTYNYNTHQKVNLSDYIKVNYKKRF